MNDTDNNQRTALKRFPSMILLPCIVILAAILRCLHLTDRSVWFDESSSWRTIQFPFFEMFSRISQNVHPPLYYIILKIWRGLFGDSVLMLRGLSVLFAVMSLLLLYRLTLRLFSEDLYQNNTKSAAWGIACMASLLFAISVFQIRQAWEMRMYSMGVFLTLLSTNLLYDAIFSDVHKKRNWIFYGVTAALCLYTHYATLFSLIGQFTFVTIVLFRDIPLKRGDQLLLPDFRLPCYAYGLSVLLFLPWFGVFLRQRAMVKDSWWDAPFQWSDAPSTLFQTIVPSQCYDIPFFVAVVFLVFLTISFAYAVYRFALRGWLLFCVGLIPFGMIVLQSIVSTNLMTDRYLIFQQPFYLIALASVSTLVKGDVVKVVLGIAVAVGGLDAYYSYQEKLDINNHPGARGTVAFLQRERKEGDIVLVSNPLLYFPIRVYDGPESRIRVYSPSGENFVHFCGGPLTCPEDFMTDYEMYVTTAGRVWVITTSGDWSSDFRFEVPENWSSLGEREDFPDFGYPQDYIVQLYQVVSSDTAEIESDAVYGNEN